MSWQARAVATLRRICTSARGAVVEQSLVVVSRTVHCLTRTVTISLNGGWAVGLVVVIVHTRYHSAILLPSCTPSFLFFLTSTSYLFSYHLSHLSHSLLLVLLLPLLLLLIPLLFPPVLLSPIPSHPFHLTQYYTMPRQCPCPGSYI